MGYGVSLMVEGDYALFTRPEMKAERVSYDVITPSAACGVLSAIYWHPGLLWRIDRIKVLSEIRFDAFRRNELGGKISYANVRQRMRGGTVDLHQHIAEDRQQRASLLLRDVRYVIDAHFELDHRQLTEQDTPEKFYNIFLRRARAGQHFSQPYLGCREFAARTALLEDTPPPVGFYDDEPERDLGWMLWYIDFEQEPEQRFTPRFFRAVMRHGVIDVPKEAAI